MKSYIVVLQGQASGGSVTIRVLANGVAADTVQATTSGQQPRNVVDSILNQMSLPTYDVPVRKVDRSGPAMLIVGADSVQTLSSDPGLEIFEQAFDGEVGLKPSLTGGTIPPPASSSPGPLPASDLAVLGHLERLIGSLADGSAATPKLLKAAMDAHRTFAQGTLAYLTGTPLPYEPNPGSQGNIALDGDSTQSVLTGLANSSSSVVQAVSSLADASSNLLIAASNKEKEAKKGGSGTANTPKPTTPSVNGPGAGSGGGPGQSGGGPGQSGGGNGQPAQGSAPYTGPKFKPAGAPNSAWTPLGTPRQIKVTTIAGMTFVRGFFPDGKVYLSSGQTPTIVDDGQGHVWLEPKFENFTVEIDNAKFEAMIAKFQEQIRAENAKAAAEEGWTADVPKIVSMILSSLPIIGQIKTGLEALIGIDLVTFEALDPTTRAIYALTCLAFSPVGARMFQGLKSVSKSALGALKTAIEGEKDVARALASLDQAATKAALQEAEELATQAAKETVEKGIETEVREVESAATAEAEQGCRVHVCFGAGTRVRLADGTWSAIERIRAGQLVVTRSVLAMAGSGVFGPAAVEDPPRHVVRTFSREAADCVRLVFEGVGGRSELVCTREHPFAVGGVFRPASRISPGTRVDTRDGRGAKLLSRQTLSGRRPVFNLEIADGHTYFVTELELWVHNQCEKASQKQMEGHITKNPDKFTQPFVDAKGNPVSEPAFYKGKYIGKGRAEVQAEIDAASAVKNRIATAYRQGKATRLAYQKAKDYVDLLQKRREYMTFPDAVVVEKSTGETLALELKTVKVEGGVEGRFNYADPDVDYGLSVMEQTGARARLMQPGIKQVLVIDMRAKFPDLFKLTGDAARKELERLMETEVKPALSQGIWASESASEVKDMWTDIRFLTGPDGDVDMIGGFSLK